jgi:hypothetical protein
MRYMRRKLIAGRERLHRGGDCVTQRPELGRVATDAIGIASEFTLSTHSGPTPPSALLPLE